MAVRWVRLVGARPRSVADYLRVREVYEFERVRRDPYLSCARLCLTVRKARVQMRAESIHDVTSIKVQRGSSLTSSLSSLLCPQSAPPQHGMGVFARMSAGHAGHERHWTKNPCPDAVCAGRLKTSRPTTNSTLIYVLSFRALLGTKIGLLGVCLFNGRILLANPCFSSQWSYRMF